MSFYRQVELEVSCGAEEELRELLGQFGTLGILELEEEGRNLWRAFFPHGSGSDPSRELQEKIAQKGLSVLVRESRLIEDDPEEWIEAYRRHFQPIAVAELFYIHPPWLPAHPEYPLPIVMEPSQAFGTGSHESTRLCLQALAEMGWQPRSILDVGTGSGILAIAAARLVPTARVLALDVDEKAASIARENLRRNGIPGVPVLAASLPALRGVWELTLANLSAPLLRELAGDLMRVTSCDMLISGFTTDQSSLLEEAFPGWRVKRCWQASDWICWHLQPTDAGGISP